MSTLPLPCPGGSRDWYYDVILNGLELKPIYEHNYNAAYSQGMAAGATSQWRQNNPYNVGTLAHRGWDEGWMAVEKAKQT